MSGPPGLRSNTPPDPTWAPIRGGCRRSAALRLSRRTVKWHPGVRSIPHRTLAPIRVRLRRSAVLRHPGVRASPCPGVPGSGARHPASDREFDAATAPAASTQCSRRARAMIPMEFATGAAHREFEVSYVDSGRSNRFRAVQERIVRGRRRDGGDRVPHHVLRGAAGQHGLLDIHHRYPGQRRRAGPDPAHAPRLGPDRARRGARPLRQRRARRRRLCPERPVRGRDAPARHLHVQAGVRGRRARRVRMLHRAPGGHRRPGPRLERRGLDRDLPGGAADPANEAARRRGAQRDPVAPDRAQRAHPRPGVRRSARAARGVRDRRARDSRAGRLGTDSIPRGR